MIGIDYFLGDKAEFLNAWSVVQRFFGANAEAGKSAIYLHYGQLGELTCVLLVNMFLASLLVLIVNLSRKKSK